MTEISATFFQLCGWADAAKNKLKNLRKIYSKFFTNVDNKSKNFSIYPLPPTMSTPELIVKKDKRPSSSSSSSSSSFLPSLHSLSSVASSGADGIAPGIVAAVVILPTPPTQVILRKQYDFCADQKNSTLLFQVVAAKSVNIIAETISRKKVSLIVGAVDGNVPAQNILLSDTLKEFDISFKARSALQVVTPKGSDSTPGVFSRYSTALTTHAIPIDKSYFGAGPTGTAVFFVVPQEYVSAAEIVLSMVPQ